MNRVTPPLHLLVFRLDEQRYALRLSAAKRVIRVVEITPLAHAPAIVLGIINVQGQILPVVNVRKRFGLPERELDLSDHCIIAGTLRRTVALVVDAVSNVIACGESQMIEAETILPGLEHIAGLVTLPDGILFVHDLDRFLSLDEEQALVEALLQTEGNNS